MVRINITSYNTSNNELPLNFQNTGQLIMPINGSMLSVLRFSIPNGCTPLVKWNNAAYSFTLTYSAFAPQTAFVQLEDRGTGIYVYELKHLVASFNNTLASLMTLLDTASGHSLPSTTPPYVVFDPVTNFYSFIAPIVSFDSGLSTKIQLFMNEPLYRIFQSMNFITHPNNPVDTEYELYFSPSYENTYRTDMVINTQESISLPNYAYLRVIIITSDMPVEPEIFCSINITSNQVMYNVIQNFTVNYDHGTVNTLTNNDYQSITNDFRMSKISAKDMYYVRCNILYLTIDGEVKPFNIPPRSAAHVLIEIK
jgi:hypothetical protein